MFNNRLIRSPSPNPLFPSPQKVTDFLKILIMFWNVCRKNRVIVHMKFGLVIIVAKKNLFFKILIHNHQPVQGVPIKKKRFWSLINASDLKVRAFTSSYLKKKFFYFLFDIWFRSFRWKHHVKRWYKIVSLFLIVRRNMVRFYREANSF